MGLIGLLELPCGMSLGLGFVTAFVCAYLEQLQSTVSHMVKTIVNILSEAFGQCFMYLPGRLVWSMDSVSSVV